MSAQLEYQRWLNHQEHTTDLKQDLASIDGNDREIEDRFGCDLNFGTGGLRGILGAGLNRMNIYTVRKASWALAQYVLQQGPEMAKRGIVIGYDCRRGSKEFAEAAGLIMAAVGVRAYVSPYLCPTPELSFAVRELHAAAGVMITASHNPPEYNGYKVYGHDGGQILSDAAKRIRAIMAENRNVFELPVIQLADAERAGLFEWVPESLRATYIGKVIHEIQATQVTQSDRDGLRIVYTPLHGTGHIPIRDVLAGAGYADVFIVDSQAQPDGDFPTVKSPNPEEPEALKLAIEMAKEVDADVVLGTDPDADRVGIAVRIERGSYQLLTGNQVGALLMDYILRTRKESGQLPENGIVFKTIVTSQLGQVIAASYGVPTEDTLTGFKYIGDKITEYEQSGEHAFLFGYEESYGYLLSPIVRDKDAVQTALAIVEMATYHRAQQRTILEALGELYQRFGYYRESLLSLTLAGADGLSRMQGIMQSLRKQPLCIPNANVISVEDYLTGERTRYVNGNAQWTETAIEPLELPTSEVLKFFYDDSSWIAIRPSGTEPKLKAYIAVCELDERGAINKVERIKEALQELFKHLS